jgi:hypothetical protein
MTSHEQFETTVIQAIEGDSLTVAYSTDRRVEKQGDDLFIYYTKEDMQDVDKYIEWVKSVV